MTMNRAMMTSMAACAVCSLWAGSARAATFSLDLSGVVGNGAYSMQDNGVTHYDQWVLSLTGLDALNAITVAQGDTINATITLDQLFTIPASQQLTFVGLVLGGASFPKIDTGVSGSFALNNGLVEAAAGTGSTTTSGQLVNAVVFYPPSNGSITFDSIFTSFTIDTLAQSATLDYALLTYTLFSPSNGVPEPATWAMMVLGFGGMGAMLRRRRQTLRLA